MKKCFECNVEMIDNLGIRSDESNSINNSYKLYIIKNPQSFFGRRASKKEVSCRICPNCGKVELYIDPNELNIN